MRERVAYDCFVFLRFQRAGGINDPAADDTCFIAALRISNWRCCRSVKSSGRSFHLISGLRASVPVPEQGTSASTRSKTSANGSCKASAVMTCTLACGALSRRIRARCGCNSAATISASEVLTRWRRSCRREPRNNPGFARLPDERSHQLRPFILDGDATFAKCRELGHIAFHQPSG